LLVLADHERARAGGDADQEMGHAEIAVRQPHVAGLHERQHLAQQRPLLRVRVLTRDHAVGQPGGGVEGHQTEPGQRAGGLVARLLQAVLGGGQMIAVEQAGAVPRQPRGQRGEALDHGGEAVGPEADECGGDVRLDARQLVVDGGKGDREGVLGGPIGGPDGGTHAANGLGEQVEGGGEV
jgi:hypothetical protein